MTTTMHFGPEWMRSKQQPFARPHPPPSPPPLSTNTTHANAHAPPGATSYSALVAPAPPPPAEKNDLAHPFKYSKTELLRVWKDGGGRGQLPIEVERWEGIVREIGGEPSGAKEMTEAEKKLFASSINSELRRRQSTDFAAQGERPKMHHAVSGSGSPLRETFPGIMGRRRRGDSTGADQRPLTLNPKSSWTTFQGALPSPGLPSPRPRIGINSAGFDGVLKRGLGKRPLQKESDTDVKDGEASDIKEEEENVPDATAPDEIADKKPASSATLPSVTAAQVQNFPPESSSNVKAAQDGVANLSLNSGQSSSTRDGAENNGGPETGRSSDLASIEWSYLDFSGNIQGPFRADTMQAWYDQQYFTDDLLMKRTHLDTDWTSVADLKRRIQEDKIFLSPMQDPSVPPGLARRPEGSFDPYPQRSRFIPQEASVFDAPYQPIPQQPARSATLDSYLNDVSMASGSPSSSYGGGGFGRPSISPDPLSITGRVPLNTHGSDLHFNGRAGPSSYSGGNSPAMSFMPRRTYNDASPDPMFGTRPSFGEATPGRSSTMDSGFSNTAAWGGQGSSIPDGSAFDGTNRNSFGSTGGFISNPSTGFGTAMDGFNSFRPPSSHDGSANNVGLSSTPFGGPGYGAVGSPASQNFTGVPFARSSSLRNEPDMGNGLVANGIPFKGQGLAQKQQSPALSYAAPQLPSSLPPLTIGLNQFQSPALSPNVVQQQNKLPQPQAPSRGINQSPWGAIQEQPAVRPRPFDPPHPTSSNTVVVPQNTPSPWQTVQARNVQRDEPAPKTIDDGWGEYTEEPQPQSLTFSHVNQHNQLQQGIDRATPARADAPHTQPLVPTSQTLRDPPPHQPPAPKQPATAVSNLPVGDNVPESIPVAPVPTVKSPMSGPSTAPAKAPWSTEEDAKKQKPSGVTMGLREIQEAEKKKKEDARKTSEKDKPTRTASSPQDDVTTFTATWGLPTSQAGKATPASTPKEPGVSSATTTSTSPSGAPAWTNATKTPAAKKTMKEIQEEEERRKKLAAKEKETVAQAAKRAYADSTAKVASPVQAAGGAWTTVGSGGKPSAVTTPVHTPPVGTAARPAIVTQVSSTSTVSQPQPAPSRQVNGAAPPVRPATSAQAASKVATTSKAATPKVDEEPAAPTPDFMRWLRDSLRGLNSSVSFEEIAQMLLSFPLDPDPSTIELIAETVYGASTTLDGRRFASEFIAKRKADAALRPKGTAPIAVNGKATSLASVVKSQPKPASPEWGGYKVVKKKGKSGRA
ncbi:hypothetical protein BD410DRAFT_252651 [Rickenella mellea]|uniref:GYF domain-containing protein n=1 Tax=Rickenella mellea TaxID=50990 RepID=A0A4Y7QNE9_9AGAM|nr:hypothetical protein BD410DRAFT_252651 [Rickenella mellea]